MTNISNKRLDKKFIATEVQSKSIIDNFLERPKGLGFRKGFVDENTIGISANAFLQQNKTFEDDPNYTPFTDDQLKSYVSSLDYFKSSKSALETKYLIGELERESSIIGMNPGAYFLGRLTGGILDPVSYAAFSMKAFRTTSGALDLKKITAVATAEELYKQALDDQRESELGLYVPIGTAVGVGLLNGIGKLRNKKGGEAIAKYNKDQDLLDAREAAIANNKIKDGDNFDNRILNPDQRIERQSGGARVSPGREKEPSYNDDLYDEAIKKTYTGVENSPLTPVFRLLNSPILKVREIVTDLLDTKLIQNKNTKGIGTTSSIEYNIARKYIYVNDAKNVVKDNYKSYLKDYYTENNLGSPNFINKKFNTFARINFLGEDEFQRRVTYQLLRVDGSDAIDQVNIAARSIRENFFKKIGREADEQELFSLYSKVTVRELKKVRDRIRKNGKNSTIYKNKKYSLEQIEKKIIEEESRLAQIQKFGPLRKGFLPRYWNRDLIKKDKIQFKKDLIIAFNNKGQIFTSKEIDEIIEDIVTSTPFNKLPKDVVGPDGSYDLSLAFQSSGISKHLRNRVLDFDDEFLMNQKYLESNINIITKQYFNSIVPDIEIAKVFGDVSMMGLKGPGQGYKLSIPEIRLEWDNYINSVAPSGTRPNLRKDLIKKRDTDIRDIEASRDLLRGTYGLPEGPESAIPAALRTLKNVNNMIFLTGFLSAAPDMARLIMQNGFKKGFGQTFEVFANSANRQILKLSKKEAAMVGEALDLAIAGRANTIGNIDDMVYGMNSIERATGAANSFYFTFINLMNVWNTGMKTASSYIGSTKILEFVDASVKGTISKGNRTKLGAGGINIDMARRINAQYKKYGLGAGGAERGDLKYSRVARSDLWDDRAAAEAFGNALRKDIRTTIVTPDKGDVPLWMNTQVGSVLSQFKKFGMAATQSILMRGLQERDQNFFIGLGVLVGMGALVDSIRQSAFNRDYEKKPLGDKISSAIDRSGAIGIFSDVNRILEVMSDNDLGIAPLLGAGKPYSSTNRQKAGLIGPTGSLGYNLWEILLDTGSGNYNYTTARAIRRSLPLQNIWYLDGIFDRFEKGIR
jgi:hypothetical protein